MENTASCDSGATVFTGQAEAPSLTLSSHTVHMALNNASHLVSEIDTKIKTMSVERDRLVRDAGNLQAHIDSMMQEQSRMRAHMFQLKAATNR